MATPRLIPDHECKQGKCGATTTGCWDQCSLKQSPVNFVGLAFPVAPLIPTEQQPANEESEADCALIQRLGGLLAEIAIIMKGPEPARTRWSYADLPELVAVMAVELDMYRTVYGTTFPEGWGTPPAVTAKPDLAAPVEQPRAIGAIEHAARLVTESLRASAPEEQTSKSTLGQQVARARAEVATWPDSVRESAGIPPQQAADPRPVVGIVDERYLRPTSGGEGQ